MTCLSTDKEVDSGSARRGSALDGQTRHSALVLSILRGKTSLLEAA